jgi:hypothetical protein
MSVMAEMLRLVCENHEHRNGIKQIILSEDNFREFITECGRLHRIWPPQWPGVPVKYQFMGYPVVCENITEFCRNCGAEVPMDCPICTYCLSRSQYIRVE